ncbi:unnamed protein product [Penicillium salamii]|uniref:Uncharacterized protein n=1 Tax=Penicillium salamii TaxID=1612424 RepID=A0A9W4N7Y1_9EURO|nr:unnamed protein product [Penicillium salamii]CAG8235770.1 unnamed protein product [Penicillium salamii]CAG8291579.1 unnamed protein product [Penicillium salamii]CAG8293478.1 unnamed protein product [Penicillium salamii]CAG8399990.1 unnamed protein product [Penicillium salamii]
MIRRGPTLIALEENDVDALERIFFRYSLVVDLDRLHLEPSESASPHDSEYIVRSSAVNSDPGTSLPISSHGPDPPKLKTYASSQELKSHSGRTIPFHSPKQTEPGRSTELIPPTAGSNLTRASSGDKPPT